LPQTPNLENYEQLVFLPHPNYFTENMMCFLFQFNWWNYSWISSYLRWNFTVWERAYLFDCEMWITYFPFNW